MHIRLAWVFIHLQELEYAHDEIEQFKKYYPEDPEIYEAMGDIYNRKYDYGKAEFYLKKAIDNAPQRPFSYRRLAWIYFIRDNKLEEAINLLVKAYLLEKNITETEFWLTMITSHHPISANRFIEMLDKFQTELGFDSNMYKELLMRFENATNKIDPKLILKRNLSEIFSLCLVYKITPVLITYPMYTDINKDIREFSLEKNALIVDAEKIFNNLFTENKPEKYFVRDGHLNNEGYRILAEEIGNVLSRQSR